MSITNEDAKTMGLILLVLVTAGTITYTVYETGEELTCRTNKPVGWEIIENFEGYSKAVCNYATKDKVIAYCSEFRSTGSYERYGCKEVILIEKEQGDTYTGKKETCPVGEPCRPIG